MIRDRDSKYRWALDEVFRSRASEIIPTPIKAPLANASAERFVGTLRRECLDRLLIVGRRHLESVLSVYAEHYNAHRPHRALGMEPPAPRFSAPLHAWTKGVQRRDLIGGLIHEYERAA